MKRCIQAFLFLVLLLCVACVSRAHADESYLRLSCDAQVREGEPREMLHAYFKGAQTVEDAQLRRADQFVETLVLCVQKCRRKREALDGPGAAADCAATVSWRAERVVTTGDGPRGFDEPCEKDADCLSRGCYRKLQKCQMALDPVAPMLPVF